jgi:hypothetical protein
LRHRKDGALVGLTRREWLLGAVAGGLGLAASGARTTGAKINRRALVTRHNPVVTTPDPASPLQIGNGEFAFTADVTGLQTFGNAYERGMQLGTMSQWGWHTFPNTEGYKLDDLLTLYDSHGRSVPYPDGHGSEAFLGPSNAFEALKKEAGWLFANPQRIHLGRIGLILRKADGGSAALVDVASPRQELDLWTGALESHFEFDGRPVLVETQCHPERDLIAIRLESPLLATRRIGVSLAFPYASPDFRKTYDWISPDRHQTNVVRDGTRADLERVLDRTRYWVSVGWPPGSSFVATAAHRFEVFTSDRDEFELVVAFSPNRISGGLPRFREVQSAASKHWQHFWSDCGAIELSGSTDPRAEELERRIVLSQYLTAVNCAGSLPPQETGLVTNSWCGKFHLEMHWWHAAHFALWGRQELLERSLPWYFAILPSARETARRQGYRGARWPKQVGPDGREAPSDIGVFLIWQQPHPIYYAELIYRARPTRSTLERYRELVFETAEFMASYAAWDPSARRYVLGPPLIPAQESYAKIRRQVINPTFELAYWYWGLSAAQKWRERLGMARQPEWDKVIAGLSRPTVRNRVYAAIEVEPYTIYSDHPSMLAGLGVLPKTPLIDEGTMLQTFDDVSKRWDWKSTWGWDYPLMAMTAARLGQPARAVDSLLMDTPKNRFLLNGHNLQVPLFLPLYLPGNGGLLYAVAMMAAGWDGCPKVPAPGFPQDGRWQVRCEGIRAAP